MDKVERMSCKWRMRNHPIIFHDSIEYLSVLIFAFCNVNKDNFRFINLMEQNHEQDKWGKILYTNLQLAPIMFHNDVDHFYPVGTEMPVLYLTLSYFIRSHCQTKNPLTQMDASSSNLINYLSLELKDMIDSTYPYK